MSPLALEIWVSVSICIGANNGTEYSEPNASEWKLCSVNTCSVTKILQLSGCNGKVVPRVLCTLQNEYNATELKTYDSL